MFSHYLITAVRSIRKNWAYSILSICCLAIGTAMFSAFFYGINYKYYRNNRRPLYDRSAIVYEDMLGNEMYSANRKLVQSGFHGSVSFDMLSKLDIPEIEYVSVVGTGRTGDFKIYDSTKTYLEGNLDGMEVCGDFFKFNNLTLLYGDRIPQNDYEIVVTESFLKRIGYDKEISQCQILERDINEYHIVNVVRDDKWSRYMDYDIFFYVGERSITMLICPNCLNVDVVLKEGVDINDVNKILSTSYIHENTRTVVQLSHTYPKPQDPLLGLLSIVVLIVAAINFFKHTVMLLKQRGRANIIRYSLGAGRNNLSLMLMTEVAVILICSLAIALYLTYYTCSWLNTARFLTGKYFHFNDLAILDILGICLVGVIGFVVCRISVNRQNRLLKQRIVAERRENKTFKNIVICIETSIAVFAMAAALHTYIKAPRPYNPLPKSVSCRTFFVENDEMNNYNEFYGKIRELPQVDDVVLSYGSWNDYPNYSRISAGGRFFDFVFLGPDIRYFSFFDIPIEWLDPIPPTNGFLVDRSTYDELIKEGVDLESLEFTSTIIGLSKNIHISGIIDHYMCDDITGYTENQNRKLLGDRQVKMHRAFYFRDAPSGGHDFFVKFNNSVSPAQAESLIREVWTDMYPMASDGLNITHIPEYVDEDFRFRILAFNLGSIICILLVILSVSSSISAETNMRRKEVALRKINGAKGGDIMELFIKPYGIILAVAFVIGNLAAFAFLKNDYSGYADTFLLIAPATLLAMVLIILFTVFRRISIIMRTNPADVIKSE